MFNESSEIHTSFNDHSHSQISLLPTRTNRKISREYLTQHITYRAQRLASKVEPDMVNYLFFSFIINLEFLDNTKTSCSNT